MNEENVMKFGYDFFEMAKQKGLKIVGLEEDAGVFSVDVFNRDPECLQTTKEVLDELLSKWEFVKDEFDVLGSVWRVYFKIDEALIDTYESFKFAEGTVSKHKTVVIESDDEDEEEEKADTVDPAGKIVKQEDGVTVFEDGTIEIELKPWEFECVPKAIASLMPMMKYAGFIPIYDWARMIGLFLGDDEFKDNELLYPDGQSGRWLIKGKDPVRNEYYFELHDIEGGDLTNVYAKSKYGIHELMDWLEKRYKESTPVKYTRSIKLPAKETGEFGIDDDGNPWHTWNRCGWLKELGIK